MNSAMLGKQLAAQNSLSRGASPLHRMDARIKILAAMVCLIAVAWIQEPGAGVAVLLFGVGLVGLAGLHPKCVALRLAPANLFFLGLTLVLGLTYPGQVLAVAPWISQDGLTLSLRIALKGNALLLIFIALLCTSSVPALAQAMHRLRLGRQLPLLLALTFRQLFLVAEEFQRLYRAALARGFTPQCSRQACRTIGVLFGQTLLRSLARAERIHAAMLLRGFTGHFHTLNNDAWSTPQALQAFALCIPPVLIVLHEWLAR